MTTSSAFDRIADHYDAGRPGYPSALFEALAQLRGRRLDGARVVDVGAGTGIAARALHDRGARVLAVDTSAGMLARLRERTPSLPAVLGDGVALPVPSGSVDLVTYAQSWHWLEPARAVREAARALRSGGAMAAWWNQPSLASRWVQEMEDRLAAACPAYHPPVNPPVVEAFGTYGLTVRTAQLAWTRRIPMADFLAHVRSLSYVASLDRRDADALIDAERVELSRVFPDGTLTQPLRVFLAVGRKAGR